MRIGSKSPKLIAIGGMCLFVLASLGVGLQTQGATDTPNTGMADPDALISAFDRYLANTPAAGVHLLTIPLMGLRGLSSESFNAGGNVKIDSTDGAVTSEIRGLPQSVVVDLWLIDNRPGHAQTTFAESQDLLLKVGTYVWTAGLHTLSATLGGTLPAGFYPDRAFVVRTNQSPLSSFILTGSATTFDRLVQRQVRFVNEGTSPLGFDPANPSTRRTHFERLVAQGRKVFLNEQFDGNGRACGTCHVENNNFTIDPGFISSLPPNNPLLSLIHI